MLELQKEKLSELLKTRCEYISTSNDKQNSLDWLDDEIKVLQQSINEIENLINEGERK